MKKILKILVITVLVFLTLFGLYRVYQKNYYKEVYESLSNVFLEMNYAEINSGVLPGLTDFSKAVDGSQSYHDKDIIVGMNLEAGLSESEAILVYVGIEKTFLIEYRRLLPNGRYLFIDYDYSDKILKQTIEVSESDQSLAYGLIGYNIEVKSGKESDLELHLKSSYSFSSTKGLPSFQLTDPNEVLEYLKPYGIDEAWIKEKSHFMLYDVVLERWFKNGSQRYSVENLGDVEIVPLSFIVNKSSPDAHIPWDKY